MVNMLSPPSLWQATLGLLVSLGIVFLPGISLFSLVPGSLATQGHWKERQNVSDGSMCSPQQCAPSGVS